MSLIQDVADLTTATTTLINTINIQKASLDSAVFSAVSASTSATNSANIASVAQTSASASALSASNNASIAQTSAAAAAYSASTVSAITLPSYSSLRSYSGALLSATITGYNSGNIPSVISGVCVYDSTDTTSADNGGTIIVDSLNRRWKRQINGAVNIDWFYTSASSTDATSIIQTALNFSAGKYPVEFGPNTYTTSPITIPSNSIIIFKPTTIISAKVGYGTNDCVFNINNATNVTINGNNGTIQMNKPEYTSGEWRHGLSILSSNYVEVRDLYIKNTGGDGFYVGSPDGVTASTNIVLDNCTSDNARRNGLSIVSVKDCWIRGGEFKNTTGTAPQFGIDIEPNSSSDSLENVNLIGVVTRNNNNGGIQFVPGSFGAQTQTYCDVNISNSSSVNDGYYGALRFANPCVNQVSGRVNVTNHSIINPVGRGVDIANWSTLNPIVTIRGLLILNPCFSMTGPVPGNVDRSGIAIYTSNNTVSYTTANIFFDDVRCIDNRSVPIMYSGAYVGGTYYVDSVTFKNLKVTNSTNNKIVLLNCTNINVTQDNPEIVTLTTSPIPNVERQSGGGIITSSISANHTLSTASTVLGLEITFMATSATISIFPATGDSIFFNGLLQSAGLPLDPGCMIKLKARPTGWEVIASDFPLLTGSGSPTNNVIPRFIGSNYFDITGKVMWQSVGLTSTDWKQLTN